MDYSHDDFWLKSSHTGFDFDTADGQGSGDSKFSNFLKKDEFNPLRCSGLDDVAENASSADSILPRISARGRESYALKFTEKSNPLLILPKDTAKVKGCGSKRTVRNMIFGLDYSLNEYKSKKEKLDLLKAAENTHDGNAILEVVLYLKNTLKKSIFQKEILGFPNALNVYLAYLEEDHMTDELANMLQLSDRAEEAAFLKYEAAVQIEDPERKLQRIQNCVSTDFQLVSTESLIRLTVEEHCRILNEQIDFFKNNVAYSFDENEMKHFENLTGRKSVVDSSIICSLIYSCLFFYKSQMNSHNLTCPTKLMSSYKLTKKQFTWAALRALASLQKWSDVDDLFMSKNWLGSFKVRSCISISRVLEALFKTKVPAEVLKKYVASIDDDEEKLRLAEKYSCHSVAIEVLKNNKDRLGLIKYKSNLEPHSDEFRSIIGALSNPTARWKN